MHGITITESKSFTFLGFKKPGEKLDPYATSTILMFAFFQFLYILFCLVPTFLFYNYEILNMIYLGILVTNAVWKGGTYYIQIFSQRYNSKFVKAEINAANDKQD